MRRATGCWRRRFFVAAALVDERVGTIEDTDIGARVGLRWRRGPFELMNHAGIERARDARRRAIAGALERCRSPAIVDGAGARADAPFRFELVRTEVAQTASRR